MSLSSSFDQDDFPHAEKVKFLKHMSDGDLDSSNIQFPREPTADFFKKWSERHRGGLPILHTLSVEQVHEERMKHAVSIFEQFDFLSNIWQRHAPTIIKRWSKKTKKERIRCLSKCWPDMPASHRPDFDICIRGTRGKPLFAPEFRDAFLIPFMNQEDLSKPDVLPLLLKSRARFSPAEFAFHDRDVFRYGRTTLALLPAILKGYVMLFDGRDVAATYGELIPWIGELGDYGWTPTSNGMYPGEGLLVLEAQHKILDLSVGICKQILPDIQDLTNPICSFVTEPPSARDLEADGSFSLTTTAAEAPYLPRIELKFGRMVDLLKAKARAAEDEALALREDPGYFLSRILEMKEHCTEHLLDSNMEPHPEVVPRLGDKFWSRVIRAVTFDAMFSLEAWSDLQEQAVKLQRMHDEFKQASPYGGSHPEQFLKGLLKFRYNLNHVAAIFQASLMALAPASPPLRPYFLRLPYNDSDHMQPQVIRKPSAKISKAVASVTWLVHMLFEDGAQLLATGMTATVDELEWIIQSEPEARKLISSCVASHLADLGVICECLRQIESYPLRTNSPTILAILREEIVTHDCTQQKLIWDQLRHACETSSKHAVTLLRSPKWSKLYYPVEKRRSRETVEAMRGAESTLDKVWKVVDSNLQRSVSDLQNTAFARLLTTLQNPQRTPPWHEVAESRDLSASTANKADVCANPTSDINFELQYRTEQTLNAVNNLTISQSKAKVKTKGVSRIQEEDVPNDSPPDPQTSVAPPIFPVDNRALRVFRALFYDPSKSFTPGEIAWTDFMHAMANVGFGMETLKGSERKFTSVDDSNERQSIVFHEPHPTGKISYMILRRMGRRLSRRFDWYGDMFVLAEKN